VTSRFRINVFIKTAGHAADAGDERQRRIAALRLADQLQAGRAAGADVVAGLVRRRSLQASRPIPHARLGEATWPLEEGRMDETTFMDDLYRAFDDRAQVDPRSVSTTATGICWSG
jgi:hypothetical protein